MTRITLSTHMLNTLCNGFNRNNKDKRIWSLLFLYLRKNTNYGLWWGIRKRKLFRKSPNRSYTDRVLFGPDPFYHLRIASLKCQSAICDHSPRYPLHQKACRTIFSGRYRGGVPEGLGETAFKSSDEVQVKLQWFLMETRWKCILEHHSWNFSSVLTVICESFRVQFYGTFT